MEKEKIDDKEEKEKKELAKKELRKKQNAQLSWAVFLMVSMILIIVLVPYVKHNYFDKFEYLKLNFQKTKMGDTMYYSTIVPVSDGLGNIKGSYTLGYNRNDPRDLDYINVDIPSNLVTFKKNATVYITLDPEMKACPENNVALQNLAGFLSNFAGLNVKPGVSDKNYSEETGIEYVTCDNNHKNSSVIFIKSGDETKIEKRLNKDCYDLTYKECEITQVSEKFMWVILDRYMSYFTKKD